MKIGLMGVSDSGVLYAPNGTELFWLPLRAAVLAQRIQHWFAQKTWR